MLRMYKAAVVLSALM